MWNRTYELAAWILLAIAKARRTTVRAVIIPAACGALATPFAECVLNRRLRVHVDVVPLIVCALGQIAGVAAKHPTTLGISARYDEEAAKSLRMILRLVVWWKECWARMLRGGMSMTENTKCSDSGLRGDENCDATSDFALQPSTREQPEPALSV